MPIAYRHVLVTFNKNDARGRSSVSCCGSGPRDRLQPGVPASVYPASTGAAGADVQPAPGGFPQSELRPQGRPHQLPGRVPAPRSPAEPLLQESQSRPGPGQGVVVRSW